MMGEIEPQDEMGLKHMEGFEGNGVVVVVVEVVDEDGIGGSVNIIKGRYVADDEAGNDSWDVDADGAVFVRDCEINFREKCIFGNLLRSLSVS